MLFNYKKAYDLKELISILSLSFENYNETKKIIELIDKAYIDDKIKLKFNNKNNNFLLIIKNKNGQRNQEIDYAIKINKNNYNINEKFDIIIKDLECLRQNNTILFEIEKKIKELKDSINNKLKENIFIIESLKELIKNNKIQLENNEHQIKLLKKEILTIKNIDKNQKKKKKPKDKKEQTKDIIIKNNKKEKEKCNEKNIINNEAKDKTEEILIFSLNKNIKEVKLNDFKVLKTKAINKKENYSEDIVEYLPTNEIYLRKKYDINFLANHQFTLLEKSELEKLSYPFLCNLIFCFQTKKNIYFVETLLLEKLFYNNHLPKYDEDEVRFYIAQIALLIEYLHSIGRKYNNLIPDDFFLDDKGYLRLTKNKKLDLDLDNAFLFVGHEEYLAPEIISNKESKNTDWWILGIFLFIMLYNRLPFINKKDILTGKIRFPKNIEISEDAKDIILNLLEKDPTKRLGSHNGIKEIKSHPFFKSINFDLILKKEVYPPFIPQLKNKDFDDFYFDLKDTEIYYNQLYLK